MKRIQIVMILSILTNCLKAQDDKSVDFKKLDESSNWELKFEDDGTGNWEDNWSLDGVRAQVSNSEEGMLFSAGSVAGDDACHAVLWSKQSFEGDVKIEYEYTRFDTQTRYVNILYIQASGHEPYDRDVLTWSDQRVIPSMRLYFNNMDALHISYAAFENDNTSPKKDYIRVRRYPVTEDFSSTEVTPEVLETGLFEPGKTYKITVIKTDQKLFFQVEGNGTSKLYSWDTKDLPALKRGRVGLRHMYTRSARYADFKVFTR